MRQETYRRVMEEAWEDAKQIGSVYISFDDRYMLYGSFEELMKDHEDETEEEVCDRFSIEKDEGAMYVQVGGEYEDVHMVYSVDDLMGVLGW